jgi:DNA polymerase-1
MIMQVHDELIFEVPNEQLAVASKKVPQLMCDVAELRVPLVVDTGSGKNWDEAH